MTTPEMASVTSVRLGIIKSLGLLVLGLLPWPTDWDMVREAVDSIRSPDSNRTEREGRATGYYESLISGRESTDGYYIDASQRLIGNPAGLVPFKEADVVHYLDGEFLQFELKPSLDRTLFGKPFLTNEFGMHDDPVTLEKPDGTFRVAVLGSSIDMGWGVAYQDTYIHQLQEWLNSHAARMGLVPGRRFEVLNFGVAAYSPMQRLETLRTKVMAFEPDLVIYSATTNDIRLTEIHLCEILRKRIDLKYDFLRAAVAQAALSKEDTRVDADGELVNKTWLKRKLQPFYWSLYDATLAAIAGDCRTAGLPLAMIIVPRVGKADIPLTRGVPVARLKAIASRQGLDVFDLTDSFDPFDPTQIEIAVGDDHPNAIGHRRLFRALARAVVNDKAIYQLLFDPGEAADSPRNDGVEPAPVRNPGAENETHAAETGSAAIPAAAVAPKPL